MSVMDSLWQCVVGLSVKACSEPLVIGRRGCMGRDLNDETAGSR